MTCNPCTTCCSPAWPDRCKAGATRVQRGRKGGHDVTCHVTPETGERGEAGRSAGRLARSSLPWPRRLPVIVLGAVFLPFLAGPVLLPDIGGILNIKGILLLAIGQVEGEGVAHAGQIGVWEVEAEDV